MLLSRESEKALRVIARHESTDDNADLIASKVKHDCLLQLRKSGYVTLDYSDPEWMPQYGLECDHYERTLLGRNYFSNKWRSWAFKNSGALIAAVGSIVSGLIGFALGRIS